MYELWRMLYGHIYYFQGIRQKLLIGFGACFGILFLICLFMCIKKDKKYIRVILSRFFFALSLAFIILSTLMGRTKMDSRQISLVPFDSHICAFVAGDLPMIAQIVGNIMVFIPLGFFASMIAPRYLSFKQVLKIGICASIMIEVIQWITRIGICEIDDIINNSLGVCIGFGLYKVLEFLVRKTNVWRKRNV